jgi:hypothetical protein
MTLKKLPHVAGSPWEPVGTRRSPENGLIGNTGNTGNTKVVPNYLFQPPSKIAKSVASCCGFTVGRKSLETTQLYLGATDTADLREKINAAIAV